MSENRKGYKIVSKDDKLFYFERSFFTLDGLWMIETEKELNWTTALKIDIAVWVELLKIIIRRIKKYLKIETNTIRDLVEIFTFRWSIEGWDYEVIEKEENEAFIKIHACPYERILNRNQERKDKIPIICNDMCKPFWLAIIKDFNPEIKVERNKFKGLGDKVCDFRFKLEDD